MFQDYSLNELKVLYNVLHEQIPHYPMLFDSRLLQDLQNYLLKQATMEGVDVSLHIVWSAWLHDNN